MKVSITSKGFTKKPQSKEISQMRFNLVDVTINDFADFIKEGRCYCNVFNMDVIGIQDKTKDNFRFSDLISVDIDHTELPMDEALKIIKTVPSIAYETYSNGNEGLFSYRFVYALNSSANRFNVFPTIDFFYNAVENELGIKTDKKTRNPYQYFNGTYGKKVIVNEVSYDPIKAPTSDLNAPSGIVIPKKEKRALDAKYDSIFVRDFFSMTKKNLIDKYANVFVNKMHSDLPTADEDTPRVYFPDEFREIRRYWYQELNENESTTTHIRRISDGMGRRNKLFINGIIRRLIEPRLTLDNVLYNLVWETYNYISNKDKQITNTILFQIARDVMRADLDRYKDLGKSKRKYMANPLYCIKHGKSKNQVAKMRIDYDAVGELYDCSLSDRDNVEVMREYGIEITEPTLKKWRLRNGIKASVHSNSNADTENYIAKAAEQYKSQYPTNEMKVNTSTEGEYNDIKNTETMTQTRKKKIDYSIVNEGLSLGLSVRKTIEYCKNKGVSISIGALQKYKKALGEQSESEHYDNAEVNTTTTDIAESEVNSTTTIAEVNTTPQEERKATIAVKYDDTILYAYEKKHRTYQDDGLTDYPLYMVLLDDDLKDYQFLDYDQLIKVGVEPSFIYNWNEGRCLNKYNY